MTICGIDPSLTRTAVCVIKPGEPPKLHTFESQPSGPDVAARIARYESLMYPVGKLIPSGSAVFIEGYSFGSKGRALSGICEYGGLLRHLLVASLCTVHEVSPSSLKKFSTGKSQAEKNTVIAHVLKRWGFLAANDDEADAYVLARIGEGFLHPHIVTCEAQREVLASLRGEKPKKKRRAVVGGTP